MKNGLPYLASFKEFLFSTLHAGDEVIIIDDNSTDSTFSALLEWQKNDSRVRLFRNPGNGLVPALNFGIAQSSHEWIARFDVDDAYSPDRLTVQRNAITDDSVAIFSDFAFRSSHNFQLGTVPSAVFPLEVEISLASGNRTAHSSVIFRKVAVLEAGGYLNEDYLAEDLSLWLRLSRLGRIHSVPKVLLGYTLSKSSISGQHHREMVKKRNFVLENYCFRPELFRDIVENFEKDLSQYNHYQQGGKRILHSLRDLRNLNAIYKDDGELAKYMRRTSFKELHTGRSMLSFMSLGSEKIFREIYRGFLA